MQSLILTNKQLAASSESHEYAAEALVPCKIIANHPLWMEQSTGSYN